MTLKNIEDHILSRARGQASEIETRAKAQAEEILAAGRKRVQEEYEAAVERLKARLASQSERELAIAAAHHRMELLEEKTRIIDDVFEKAVGKLLFSDGYWDLVREKLAQLDGMSGTIRCRAEHRETIKKRVDELNSSGAKMPPLGEPIDIAGGFILEGASHDVDFSLDAELKHLRESILPELIRKAFGEL